MAKSGTASSVHKQGGAQSAATRRLLVDGAIATLKNEGFSGASARTIAERAGLNQSLIFYHFGSVANLLLAALDAVSSDRLEHYSSMVETTNSPRELVGVATEIFRHDLDAGYMSVLAEMIAGASSTPGLGAEVAARVGPWQEFARSAIERSSGTSNLAELLPAADMAYAAVALYLGLEMLSHLDGNREPALRLFAVAQQLALLFESMAGENSSGIPS